MDGRFEHKLEVEKKTLSKIRDNKYELLSFYNYISSKYEATSKMTYINYILAFIEAINKPLNEITSNDINVYFINLQYKEIDGDIKETSGTYRAVIFSALRKFFSYLYNAHKIDSNPMDLVSRPTPKKSNQIKRDYLTPREIQRMVNNIKEDDSKWRNRNLLIIMVFLYTGIRCEALREINEDNFDFNNMTLTIIDKRNKKRVYDIDEDLELLYKKVIAQKKNYNANTQAVFIGGYTGRISRTTIAHLITKYTVNIKNKRITPHALRRSYAKNLYKETGDIYAVQSALGHEKIETTEMCYVEGDQREASTKGMNAMKKKIKF